MTVGVQIQDRVHFPVKEHLLPVQRRIINLFRDGIKNPHQALFHRIVAVHPVQFRVCLEYMQQRVHGLICDHTVLGELIVLDLVELSVKSLLIPDLVHTALLDDMEKFLCQLQGTLIFRCIIIGRKRINRKRLIVGVLRRILRRPIGAHRPVDAPLFLIHTVFLHKLITMLRLCQQRLIT